MIKPGKLRIRNRSGGTATGSPIAASAPDGRDSTFKDSGIRFLIAGFSGALVVFGAAFPLFSLRVTNADYLEQQRQQIADLKIERDRYRLQVQELERSLVETRQQVSDLKQSNASTQMRLSRSEDSANQLRELFSLERVRQESQLTLSRSEIAMAQERLRHESGARAAAEKQSAEEHTKRRQLETSFASLQSQGLWESGRPSARAHLLVNSPDDVLHLRTIFDDDAIPAAHKAQVVQAPLDASAKHAECRQLELAKHELAASLIDTPTPFATRGVRVSLAETKVSECLNELGQRQQVLDALVGAPLGKSAPVTLSADYVDPPPVPSAFANWWQGLWRSPPAPVVQPSGAALTP